MTQRERFELAAAALLVHSGCTVRSWRTSNTGHAAIESDDWAIEVPEPRGPVSFGVFAHEVGHQLLHRGTRRPRWQEEVEAEEFALQCFYRFELPGKERYERNVEKHLAYAFGKAIRRSRAVGPRIMREYPEWWARAERVDAQALYRPSMSEERSALDAP